MAFEDIVKKIHEDAQTEADSIRSIAQAEADAIREKAQRQGEEQRAELMQKAKQRADEHARRIETLAGLDMRKKVLKEKKDLIEQAFGRAEESIVNLPPADYRAFLKPLILTAVGSGNEEIIPSGRHRELFTDEFLNELNSELGPERGRLRLSNEDGDFSGGFILRDGKKETNLTLRSLLQSRHDQLEPEIAAILFGEDV
jgi:V/A-type H+-transporting ATPase subunit E